MPVNSFITTDGKRDYYLGITQLALSLNGYCATIVKKPMLERYFECEYLADEHIYILSDDDVMPSTKDTLKRLVEIMRKHPEYSQLGLGWRNDMKSEENNSWIRSKDGDIWEMDHVGGIMAIRKGTIKDMGFSCDYKNGIGDDKIMGRTARELGFKVGIVPSLYFHHLGVGQSTVWH
jgi:hypothetical protein